MMVRSSIRKAKWIFADAGAEKAAALVQKIGCDLEVARVLVARGYEAEAGREFIGGSLKSSWPKADDIPNLMAVAGRLALAVNSREHVMVFGDYDVDGAASSAIIRRFFDRFSVQCEVYVPDRLVEGYGPNVAAIETFGARRTNLLVTVDCGTAAIEPLARAKALGMDVVVIDHHVGGSVLPDCLMVNPNSASSKRGSFSYLCAAGLAFIVVVEANKILRNMGNPNAWDQKDVFGLLDIVATATVADMVPLVGLNRIFLSNVVNRPVSAFIAPVAKILETGRIQGNVEAWHFGFIVGPRINAAGRVGVARLGSDVLSGTFSDEAVLVAAVSKLDSYNADRKEIEAQVLAEAMTEANEFGTDGGVMVWREGWHPGVVGIVAGRLKERFGVPSFAFAIGSDGTAVGSGRSIKGFDIGEFVIRAREEGLLVKGGGHPMAAGVTIAAERLAEFNLRFKDAVRTTLGHGVRDSIEVLRELAVGEATFDLLRQLHSLEPFGMGNAEPRYALLDVELVNVREIGNGHRACLCRSGDAELRAVCFRAVDMGLAEALVAGTRVDLVGRVRENTFRGSKEIQFQIEDVAI